ncbi:MAG TPA: hypothetical protein VGL21_01365 [Jatrophihabitantaceae bacterium]|jgi:hypothetical protein
MSLNPFWRIFVAVFCYISAAVGLGLAVLNASEKPAATTLAFAYGIGGVIFLAGGIVLTRKPRY